MRNWGGMKREREPGTCRRPLLWIGVGLRRSKQYLARLAPNPGSLRVPKTCRRPLLWIGVGLRRSKQYLARLAPESWKSESAQIVSQTIALDWGESQEVETRLNSFGTVILEVCECSERVADH